MIINLLGDVQVISFNLEISDIYAQMSKMIIDFHRFLYYIKTCKQKRFH